MQPINHEAIRRAQAALKIELREARERLSLADVGDVIRAVLSPEEVASLIRWLSSHRHDAR